MMLKKKYRLARTEERRAKGLDLYEFGDDGGDVS